MSTRTLAVPSVEAANYSPYDYKIAYCSGLGWTLSHVNSEVSLAISKRTALRLIASWNFAVEAEEQARLDYEASLC